jgi:hypothetical protein
MSTTFGVDFPFWEVFANDFARYLTLIPFCSTISLFWGLFFFLTGAGMDIIFKDLEAETIHVCIAWALLNILGCYFCWLPSPSIFFLSFHLLRIVFSVHRIQELVNNAPLCHWYVAGWVWLRAKPWDAELFLFEIDILGGLSRMRV